MPVDVLYIHQDGAITGSAISLRNILLGLDRNRFSPRVLLAKEGPARQLYEMLGIPVDVIPIHGFWTAPGSPWYRGDYYRNFLAFFPNRALVSYLKRLHPDLVHINDKALLSAGLVASRLRIPIVWHLRSTYQLSFSRLQALISIWCIRKIASSLIAISEDEIDGFERMSNVKVINNSVDWDAVTQAIPQRVAIRTELGLSEDVIAIGMVGLLSTLKGAWDFIQVAGIVRAALPDKKLRFVIVGPIPSRNLHPKGLSERFRLTSPIHPEDKAWKLARQVGIEDQLLLTGYRSDVLAVMSALDIAVSCYRLKAIGRPAFEAMSVGCPVVVTSGHTGRSQVVRHGETGFVVPLGDLKAMANAIIQLVQDSLLRQSIGECGMHYSHQHFDPQRNARLIEQVYEGIIH